MNSTELIHDLCSSLGLGQPCLQVIPMAAHDSPGTAEQVPEFGASACLAKLVQNDALLSALPDVT